MHKEVHKSNLGFPNLLVLTVTTSERHKKNIISAFSDVTGDSTALLFKSATETCAIGSLARPSIAMLYRSWDRVGYLVHNITHLKVPLKQGAYCGFPV